MPNRLETYKGIISWVNNMDIAEMHKEQKSND